MEDVLRYTKPVKCETEFYPADILDNLPIPAEDRDIVVSYMEREWWDCYEKWHRDSRDDNPEFPHIHQHAEIYAEYMKELEYKVDELGYTDGFANGRATWIPGP